MESSPANRIKGSPVDILRYWEIGEKNQYIDYRSIQCIKLDCLVR